MVSVLLSCQFLPFGGYKLKITYTAYLGMLYISWLIPASINPEKLFSVKIIIVRPSYNIKLHSTLYLQEKKMILLDTNAVYKCLNALAILIGILNF